MDFSTVYAAVDFAPVVTGVLAVAAALAGVYVGRRGAEMLLVFIELRRIQREDFEEYENERY